MLGHSVRALGGPRLLTGAAQFMADLDRRRRAGIGHRAPLRRGVRALAHGARPDRRDRHRQAARALPGVHSVWTAADLDLADQPAFTGEEALARPLLARGRVRFVGEAVAVVCAETPGARDRRRRGGGGRGRPAARGDRRGRRRRAGRSRAVRRRTAPTASATSPPPDDEFFADADEVVRLRLRHQRVAPVTMEPNGCVAVPGARRRRSRCGRRPSRCSACAARWRACSASRSTSVRVRAPWIGGGFGAKGGVYPEQIVTAALARAHRSPGPLARDASREPPRDDARSGTGARRRARRDAATAASPGCVSGASPTSARTRPAACSSRWSRG